jgi:hypothetical protein
MQMQQLCFVRSLLNLATPDLFVFMLSSLFLSTTSPGESTWDLTNRICDRYLSEKAWKPSDHQANSLARSG